MRKTYTVSWNLFTLTAEADRVLCHFLMFLTVFFHWMYKMKYSCCQESSVHYSRLVCLLGFWLRNVWLVKVGSPISDGIVFVFHLAWCVRGFKSLKRFWPYLIAFKSCISNGKPEWLLYFMSNFMKSSTVYAARLCTFVIFEAIFSYNFDSNKKTLGDFLTSSSSLKKQTPGGRLKTST